MLAELRSSDIQMNSPCQYSKIYILKKIDNRMENVDTHLRV